MRQWNINKAYITVSENGVLILKSTGIPDNLVNNVHVQIDHLNNCSISYDNYHWRYSYHSYDYMSEDERIYSNIKIEDADPNYVEEIEYKKIKGMFWWRKEMVEKYCVVKKGIVRLNRKPTRHIAQAKSWYIESVSGEVVTNVS